MSRTLFLTLAIVASSLSLSVQAADLDVKVSGVTPANGVVLAKLCDSKACWSGKAEPVAATRTPATTPDTHIVFHDIAPGAYAVQLFHDANGNGKLDSNRVGTPIEGYGFSNNPGGRRKARYDEARFQVPAAGISITVELR